MYPSVQMQFQIQFFNFFLKIQKEKNVEKFWKQIFKN